MGIELCFTFAVHWVFSMKYWSVAKKMQLLDTNKDPEKFNTMFLWIFWVGFVVNFIPGLLLIGEIFAYV